MNCCYLIESEDSFAKQKEIERLKKENHFLDALISSYDLEEVPLENALEDLDTYGFLSSKKVVLIQNIEVLKYDDFQEDFEHLFRYLEKPNFDNLLIIEARKLNNTTKVAKTLKKKCQYIEIVMDTKKYIKDTLKKYKIDSSTITYLDEYCLGDFTKISNECMKLMNYKADSLEITKKDIDDIVVKKLGDSKDLTFSFLRSLASKDIKDALEKYHELLSYDIEPLSIIGLLASQVRILYQVKVLEKKNLRDKEIASMLEEKSDYRIMKTRELTRFYSCDELLRFMQDLSNMDYQIKTGDSDGNSLIEMFILNI